jgi:hypothetical protein
MYNTTKIKATEVLTLIGERGIFLKSVSKINFQKSVQVNALQKFQKIIPKF